MAKENKEISDIVKKCKILLLDIEGTTTSISFVKDKLFPYADANVKEFLESQWENEDVKNAVAALRKLSIEDLEKKVEGAVAIPGEDAGKEEQIEGLVKSVQWQMSADRKAGPLKQLQGLIWKQGYDKGDIKGHVYDDVPPALELWRSIEGQKVYIYSSGSVQAQKLLFNLSVAGDLLPHIEGHFDTAVGAKQEPASYVTIAEKIGSKPEEILFLTDIVKEGEAARASGLQVALVSREGNAPLPDEAMSSYPVLNSFEQLTVSNKRKPDPQEDEVPAKVPKTDLEDVKTGSKVEATETSSSEMVTSSETVATSEKVTAMETVSKDADEPEKMEVEEEVTASETPNVTEQVEKVADKAEEKPVCIETTIQEVTDPKEAGDAPVCEIEPIVEMSVEKTEKNETEKMEVENIQTVANAEEPKDSAQKKVDEQNIPVVEETTAPVITVQDVTEDQHTVSEGTEIIDDLVPVVEEPPNVEMEELKNVGDVLEKECDEILSKVQDVTNLDNIPVKPLLNSIAEEPIESGNGENTNDIVESILDSEMELGEKPCEDIDINTVQEIVDAKPDGLEEKSVEVEANAEQASIKAGEKTSESIAVKKDEENKIKETTIKCSNDQGEVKMGENGSTGIVAQMKRGEISKDESAPPEVTNGDAQKGKSEPVEEKMDTTDNVGEIERNIVVEGKDNKKVPAEAVENNTDSKKNSADPENNKMESKESALAPVNNKMEIEEKTVMPVDNKMESEEDTATSVESKVETKEPIVEPVQNIAEADEKVNKMDSIDSTAKLVEDPKKTEDIAVESVENKTEIKKGTIKPVDTKMESKAETERDIKSGSDDSKSGSGDNKSGSNAKKIESDDKKSGSNDSKSGSDGTKSGSDCTKSGSDDTKSGSDDAKSGSGNNKRGAGANKMESDNSKMESENTKSVDMKMDSDESKPQESIAEPETAGPESKSNENKADGKGSSKPTVTEEVKDSATKDVQMESDATETRVNGKTNGEPDVTPNGDTSKEEELNARLSVENGDNGKEVNGANGNGESTETEKGQGDNKAETGTSDIKVKTVVSEEPRPDPIEQPVEA